MCQQNMGSSQVKVRSFEQGTNDENILGVSSIEDLFYLEGRNLDFPEQGHET